MHTADLAAEGKQNELIVYVITFVKALFSSKLVLLFIKGLFSLVISFGFCFDLILISNILRLPFFSPSVSPD